MIGAAFAVLLIAAGDRVDDAARLQKLLYETAIARDIAKLDVALQRARKLADELPLGDTRNKIRQSVLIAGDLHRILEFDGIYWDEESLPDYYDHLARRYPDFATFIAQYRLVDRTGRVLYPAQETRQFLLQRLSKSGRITVQARKQGKKRAEAVSNPPHTSA